MNNLTNNKTIKSAQESGDIWTGIPVQLLVQAFAPDLREIGVRFRAKF